MAYAHFHFDEIIFFKKTSSQFGSAATTFATVLSWILLSAERRAALNQACGTYRFLPVHWVLYLSLCLS